MVLFTNDTHPAAPLPLTALYTSACTCLRRRRANRNPPNPTPISAIDAGFGGTGENTAPRNNIPEGAASSVVQLSPPT
jgi:hypothetical protein